DPNVKEIHWSDNGTTFTVYKEPFTNNVLNQYFETEKYTSFTRQHYIYNFTKLTDGRKDKSLKGVARYQHKYFQRDRPELLGLIKRIQTSKKASETHGQETKTERIRLSTLGKEDAIIKAEPMSVVTAADTPMPASDAALFTVVPKIEAAPS
ncbi:Heat shock factor protein 4, partial [Coemansia sp. RSA 2618]